MLKRWIIRGLLFVVPIWLTVTVVSFLYGMSEQWLGALTDAVTSAILPSAWQTGFFAGGHIPGASLITLLLLLAGVGCMASWKCGQRGLRLIDHIFLSIPGVRALYSSVRKIIDAIGEPGKSRFQKLVIINWAGVKTLGFVTGTTVSQETGRKYVFVFVPHMPNPTSGFVVLVPEDEAVDTGLTPEEGVKLGMSLGVLAPPQMPIKN